MFIPRRETRRAQDSSFSPLLDVCSDGNFNTECVNPLTENYCCSLHGSLYILSLFKSKSVATDLENHWFANSVLVDVAYPSVPLAEAYVLCVLSYAMIYDKPGTDGTAEG